MSDLGGIRIDELPPALAAHAEYVLAAMRNGETEMLSVAQVATLVVNLIVDGAPAALDTLNELAAALGDNADFAGELATTITGINSRLGTAEGNITTLGTSKQPIDAMLTALAALTSANGKFLAFSGADAPAVRDIKGTVSQSGGVPTGAIVERGSNGNGEYVRFADGTQICWHSRSVIVGNLAAAGTVYRDLLAFSSWSFPAAFSTPPTTEVSIASSIYWMSGPSSTSTTAIGTVTVFSYINATSTILAHSVAVGRWY